MNSGETGEESHNASVPVPSSDPPPLQSGRRGVGLALLAGGITSAMGGAWWWQLQNQKLVEQNPSVPLESGSRAFEMAINQAGLTRLDGSPFRYADFDGRALLINFWATWCPPCVEEMPLLEAFYQENIKNGPQVLAIAADKVEPVRRFLAQHRLTLPVALGGMGVIDLVRSMGSLSGSLPFSLLLDRDRNVVQRKMGQLTAQELAQWRQL